MIDMLRIIGLGALGGFCGLAIWSTTEALLRAALHRHTRSPTHNHPAHRARRRSYRVVPAAEIVCGQQVLWFGRGEDGFPVAHPIEYTAGFHGDDGGLAGGFHTVRDDASDD